MPKVKAAQKEVVMPKKKGRKPKKEVLSKNTGGGLPFFNPYGKQK